MYLNANETEAWWLERMMDKANMVTSYKPYWLMSIIDIIVEDERNIISFEEVVNRMIANAWYTVLTFKLSFGVQDRLSSLIIYLSDTYPYLKESNRSKLLFTLENSEELRNDSEFLKMRKNLYQMAPFRLLSPFFKEATRGIKDQKKNRLIVEMTRLSYICFYDFNENVNGIVIRQSWMDYIIKNQALIKGWIQYKLILYLQARNPNVPNIPLKIMPPNKRSLSKAQNFWKEVTNQEVVYDIYTAKPLVVDNYDIHGALSIDHFIPWSFVLHDEFWNLTPSFNNVNSKKSNSLPDLDRYFNDYCNMQLLAIKKLKAFGENKLLEDYYTVSKEELTYVLSSDETVSYKALKASLESTIIPLHQIALNQGFDIWYNC
ncbi:HNH endonuclease [Acidaminobacter sp. JC074]|uniref:HNH endonuclease domain-containing protein n=1 Tax=Acidaminobacter sp. JC074 TaxID=2530199 RepID=UPI001F0E916F|nr:HNH endonuclease domain-containing protein [Acidaminobacter sp. JC074]MCH4887946.1 HNH endonuclease [Acidaminobacter sp. JC074]